jgi:phosphoesterase RecJ-like protein
MLAEIQNTSKEINKKITAVSRIIIFGHINPDGDAIGSSLGLYHYLKGRVADVKVVMPNNFPGFLKFLPGSDEIMLFNESPKVVTEAVRRADLLFYLDFNDPKRIEKLGEISEQTCAVKVLIDHHPNPVNFADFSISETLVCSTAELIFEFISGIENDDFQNKNMADCLLTGIITDTGLFNHNSERSRTFEIVAKLLDMGADKGTIIQNIYNNYPFNRMQLLGNALHNRFVFYPEFGTALIYLPKDELEKYHHQMGDTEGFVNIALSVAGVNFSALFLEKNDHVKCSFRSSGSFDVNNFARKYYNGGGHKNASGGKSFESINKTIEHFVGLIESHKNEILENTL